MDVIAGRKKMHSRRGMSSGQVRELIEKRAFQTWKRGKKRRIAQRDRIESLEKGLGVATLLAQSLAEACIRKGVLKPNEIAAVVDELDLVDGVRDGMLNPEVVRPKSPASEAKRRRPKPRYRKKR